MLCCSTLSETNSKRDMSKRCVSRRGSRIPESWVVSTSTRPFNVQRSRVWAHFSRLRLWMLTVRSHISPARTANQRSIEALHHHHRHHHLHHKVPPLFQHACGLKHCSRTNASVLQHRCLRNGCPPTNKKAYITDTKSPRLSHIQSWRGRFSRRNIYWHKQTTYNWHIIPYTKLKGEVLIVWLVSLVWFTLIIVIISISLIIIIRESRDAASPGGLLDEATSEAVPDRGG